MIKRNESGKLMADTLAVECMFLDMFDLCKDRHEVEYILNQIIGEAALTAAHDTLEALNLDDEDPWITFDL